MNCENCQGVIAQPKSGQKFCSPKCRFEVWEKAHRIKRKHPKRIRSRERDRLYTIIHKGETLAELRVQAMAKQEARNAPSIH